MAADQRKRRLSSSTTGFGYGIQDQNRAKKRDLRSSKYDFNYNTHVSLKWDDNGKRVVAKEDQIGISWRHLTPFIPSAPCNNTKLADVVTVPKDVFELNDLRDVLTYEVWQSVLTEKERNLLTQFLPSGVGANEVVQALLSGVNFNFGNPFVKWGSSLCSGDLHPDAILEHEKSFKTNKKEYYSELQQYHDNMIRSLQNMKQRCASSKDPEAEIQQIVSRSRRHEKSLVPDANGHKYHRPDENVAVMSESLSSIADEKIYYSDNQKLSVIRDAEIQKRIRNQDLIKDKHEKLMVPPNGLKVLSRPKKAEKLQKPNMTPNDGAKYMSYVKISKKQHELVKSMRQSGSNIQSKALNRLLGGLDSSSVKPYEMFVEEEQNRIHEFWLNLANKELPTALRNWKNKQLEKRQIMNSVCQEIEEKMGVQSKNENLVNPYDEGPANDEDGKTSRETSEDHKDDDSMSNDDDEDSSPRSLKNESPLPNPPVNVKEEFDPSASSSMETQSLQKPPLNVNAEFYPSSSMESQSLQNPINVKEELDPSSSLETKSLPKPSSNVNEQFGWSASMEAQSLQKSPLNVNEQFDLSEAQSLRKSPLNANQQFNSSASMENQSLQHLPFKVKKELDSSCIENQPLQNPTVNVNESFDPSLVENNSSLENPPLNDNEEFTPMDLNAENIPVTSEKCGIYSRPDQHVAQTSEPLSTISDPGTRNPATANIGEVSGSTLKNIWSPGLPVPYHGHPTTLHGSSDGQCLRRPQVAEQPTHVIDLESDMPEEDTTKDLLNRHTSHMPFFNPYPNRDRNELLHSLINHDSYHPDQKKPASVFHPTNVILESGNQFPSHFREQLQPSFALNHHRQKAQNELYMHQNMQESIYSDNNRYSIQGPENFTSLNVRDWSNARLSNPIQPPPMSSGELLNHNWLPTGNRAPGGWSASYSTAFPVPSLGSVSSSDQSLYSVLSQCNLRSRASYSPVVSTEQMIPPTNYVHEMAGGIPMTTNALPPTVSPFNYLSGGEASTTLKNPNMGWMGLGHQPPSLHDPSGKPFLKSWNQ